MKKKTSISLHPDVIKKADCLAKAAKRSRSNYLEGIIEEAMAKNDDLDGVESIPEMLRRSTDAVRRRTSKTSRDRPAPPKDDAA